MSREFLELTLEEIYQARERFTGYLRFTANRELFYDLFFLESRVYAAGECARGVPRAVMIRELFRSVLVYSQETVTLSLYESDPAVFKSMLVFFQRTPDERIDRRSSEPGRRLLDLVDNEYGALLLMKRGPLVNVFLILEGGASIARIADPHYAADRKSSVRAQILRTESLLPEDPVELIGYRDLVTSPAGDAASLSLVDLVKMVSGITDVI